MRIACPKKNSQSVPSFETNNSIFFWKYHAVEGGQCVKSTGCALSGLDLDRVKSSQQVVGLRTRVASVRRTQFLFLLPRPLIITFFGALYTGEKGLVEVRILASVQTGAVLQYCTGKHRKSSQVK